MLTHLSAMHTAIRAREEVPKHRQRPSPFRQNALLSILSVLFVLTGIINLIVGQVYSGRSRQSTCAYTYKEDDFPAYYPVELGNVILVPEETVHYPVYSNEGAQEWDSIFPPGGGFVHLGPDSRPFGFLVYHQHHCLMQLREAAVEGRATGHVYHCLNYIRQMILCEADTTLEPVIPAPRNPWNEFIGVPHVCKDWTEMYMAAEDAERMLRSGSLPNSTTEL